MMWLVGGWRREGAWGDNLSLVARETGVRDQVVETKRMYNIESTIRTAR